MRKKQQTFYVKLQGQGHFVKEKRKTDNIIFLFKKIIS